MRKLIGDAVVVLGAVGAVCMIWGIAPQGPVWTQGVHALTAWTAVAVLWVLSVRGQIK
jgi:hypothetical protein